MKICLWVCMVLWIQVCTAQPLSDAEKWLQDDSEFKVVNEGKLVFLDKAPEQPVLHSRMRLFIGEHSLRSGWVELQQCFSNLDGIDKMEIEYGYKQMRRLKLVSHQGIDKAWVQRRRVQLRRVTAGARVCVQAQVNSLRKNNGGNFELWQGPYHRRFLDGFYPYHLTLEVVYPRDRLVFERLNHPVQPGLVVKKADGRLYVDTHFEGILELGILWRAPSSS